jgi:tetratricopeptide (TPR) repeat protein
MAGGSMEMGSDAPTDEHAIPLKLEGLNSRAELDRALATVEDPAVREAFESGYRKTFTADPARRDYAGAAQDLRKVVEGAPGFAEAYRALGYAEFNQGFNVDAAMTHYLRAVELKPDYGEAHYALAFMYAMGNREKGVVHFRKAMELGVPDERNLGERFYGGS